MREHSIGAIWTDRIDGLQVVTIADAGKVGCKHSAQYHSNQISYEREIDICRRGHAACHHNGQFSSGGLCNADTEQHALNWIIIYIIGISNSHVYTADIVHIVFIVYIVYIVDIVHTADITDIVHIVDSVDIVHIVDSVDIVYIVYNLMMEEEGEEEEGEEGEDTWTAQI